MSHIQHSGSFRDLKSLLADCESQQGSHGGAEPQLPYEIKQRTHLLCSRFLGGAWKKVEVEDIRLTRMQGGMSNMLFLCQLPENCPPERNEADKTLLRVYFNPETETHLVAESVIFTLLSERKLGPRLFGIFNGGRLEEYILSRPLKVGEIRIPGISGEIARKLAVVHQLDVPIVKQPDYICEALDRWISTLKRSKTGTLPILKLQTTDSSIMLKVNGNNNNNGDAISNDTNITALKNNTLVVDDNRNGMLSRKRSLLHANLTVTSVYAGTNRNLPCANLEGVLLLNANEAYGEPVEKCKMIDLDELVKELQLIKLCVCKSKSHVNFCHNDLQEGNILLPKEQRQGGPEEGAVENGDQTDDGLVFIDFEYASYNYRGFDFANHFCEWPIDYTENKPPYYVVREEDYPTDEQQKTFFRAYLKAYYYPKYEDASDKLEAAAEQLITESAPFVPVSHFFWGVWALLQVELSPVEFGFAEYGRRRLALYFQTRENMLKLLEQDERSSGVVPQIFHDKPITLKPVESPQRKTSETAQDKKFLTVK